jgi:4-carboxymuconolactone decarboxylase
MTAPESPEDRRRRGEETWREVMVKDPPTPTTPYRTDGILDVVFSEVWSRPGLSRKERRWVTLACVSAVAQPGPITSHVRAALDSGDVTVAELREFVLHFAVYCGWPLASFVDQAVTDIAAELGLEEQDGPGPGRPPLV